MPIPKPQDGEDQKKFISRCMGNPTMRKEFPDQKKRAGKCYSTWRAGSKKKAEVHLKKNLVRIGKKLEKAVEFVNFKQLVYLRKEAPGDNQPITPVPTKGEAKDKFMTRCMKRLKSRQSKELIPARMKARCIASWNKAKGGKNMGNEVKMNVNKVLKEAFLSLNTVLRKAVEAQGKRAYLVDFSKNELIFSKWNEESSEEVYYKVKYRIAYGEAIFDSTPMTVDRSVTYESAITVSDLVELADLDRKAKEIME